jgi:hypothetical protein
MMPRRGFTLSDNHQSLGAVTFGAITDGTSNTLMFGEKSHIDPDFDAWTGHNSGLKMHRDARRTREAGAVRCSAQFSPCHSRRPLCSRNWGQRRSAGYANPGRGGDARDVSGVVRFTPPGSSIELGSVCGSLVW